jgi:hypothetical protein
LYLDLDLLISNIKTRSSELNSITLWIDDVEVCVQDKTKYIRNEALSSKLISKRENRSEKGTIVASTALQSECGPKKPNRPLGLGFRHIVGNGSVERLRELVG